MILKIKILLKKYNIQKKPLSTPNNFIQFCQFYNYPVQQHIIDTQDSNKLCYFRIQKKYQTIQQNKPVVLFHHGLFDSADTFIINSQQLSPAFYIANKGYDVWLGNTRGNKYNKDFIKKQQNTFSLDQLAKYDISAGLKYIGNQTKKKINYIGHSQGSTIMFCALSMRYPLVVNNLNVFIALGPVTYIKQHLIKQFLNIIQNQSFKKFIFENKILKKLLLQSSQNIPFIVKIILKQISDAKVDLINLQRIPIIMNHYFYPTSFNLINHWCQILRSGQFKMFDYKDQKNNLLNYQSIKPPIYDLSNIKEKIYLFTGKEDLLSTIENGYEIFQKLTNSKYKQMRILDCGHCYYMWGKNLDYMNDLLKILQQNSNT